MFVRSLLAVAVAALLAGPAHAQTKKTTTTKAAAPAASTAPAKQFLLGGWIGYEMGDLDGLQLRVDGEMPFMKLAPKVELSFVGSVGYSYLAADEGFAGVEVDLSAHVLKFVPAARFTFPVAPQFKLFADAGLGLYYASWSADSNVSFYEYDDSTLGFMLRLGGGGMFQVNPAVSLGASFMIDPMFGDYDDTTFTILAGAMFRL
jgi:hypothetical protein